MPITYNIDHSQRIVFAKAHGVLASPDVFAYQMEVWSRTDVAGYDELVDMSAVTKVEGASPANMKELAAIAAMSDPEIPMSKFAIVANDDLHYALGRMYEAIRSMQPATTKEVRVFREKPDALLWLAKPVSHRPTIDDFGLS